MTTEQITQKMTDLREQVKKASGSNRSVLIARGICLKLALEKRQPFNSQLPIKV